MCWCWQVWAGLSKPKGLPLKEKEKKMTPAQFEKRMKELEGEAEIIGIEDLHILMDRLLCECLKANGFGAGVILFEKQEKWHA